MTEARPGKTGRGSRRPPRVPQRARPDKTGRGTHGESDRLAVVQCPFLERDNLPGSPAMDEAGRLKSANPLCGLAVVILPTVTILGYGLYVYFRFLV